MNPDFKLNLYRVSVKVRPTVAHPRYYEWEVGLLSVWVFAESVDVAAGKVTAILKNLPYEITHNLFHVVCIKHSWDETPEIPSVVIGKIQAHILGFSLSLIETPVGNDADGFAEKPFE